MAYAASGASKPALRLSTLNSNILIVKGKFIDELTSVGAVRPYAVIGSQEQ